MLCDAPTGLTFNYCTFCPHCIYLYCIYLRTNDDFYPKQHKLTGCYNRDEKCVLRGMEWIFMYNSGYVFCVDLRTNGDYLPIQH
jgi:hypothetical protein